MHQDAQRIARLIVKQMEGSLSPEEEKELGNWAGQSAAERNLLHRLNDSQYVQVELDQFYSYNQAAGWEKIQADITAAPHTSSRKISKKIYALAAAAITGLIAGSILLYTYIGADKQVSRDPSHVTVSDVQAPPIARAMITLQDGSRIALDSLRPGIMTTQAQTRIKKNEDGSIAYQPGSDNNSIVYNTLTNPRGSRTVKLTLSDGTLVWLNVDSEIRYPVAFTGAHREVEVRGEVYFEVFPDKQHPFLVSTGQTSIEVTGTHFNVHAYKDEADELITLLEGGVQVSNNQQQLKLTAGQQSIVNNTLLLNNNPDLEATMAWKNGLFSFKGTDIQTIMRQLSRWYNVEFHLKDGIKENFYGDIPRDNPLSKVLNMLEMTGSVHFTNRENSIEITK